MREAPARPDFLGIVDAERERLSPSELSRSKKQMWQHVIMQPDLWQRYGGNWGMPACHIVASSSGMLRANSKQHGNAT